MFVLAIDQGTTGTTAMLIDIKTHAIVHKKNVEFKQHYPHPSWVEHDLNDIFKSVKESVLNVTKHIKHSQIHSIAITNQRETLCAFKRNGEAISRAIVWQDRRTANYCQQKQESYKSIANKTGLPLDPYFSATKINWLLNNNDSVINAYKNNDLLFGTIDTYLLYKLTNGLSFKTESSNASRTLLMNLETCKWDDELLSFFDIDKKLLPEICESFSAFGITNGLDFLPDGIPITSILGDQQAALFGQAGFDEGSLKCTYGTGAFILLNTGENIIHDNNGLLTTVAYKFNDKVNYALEGSSYIAGAAVQWLRDNLGFIKNSKEVEQLALSVSDLSQMSDVLLIPFFTGIGSPYWKPEAKASLIGLTRGTNREHIARATLEGIALAINDSINVILKRSLKDVVEIRVDGGAASNDLLMQIQSDISNLKVIRPQNIETTAYGVALGSLLYSGDLTFNQIESYWSEDAIFKPVISNYIQTKKEIWKNYLTKNFI